MEISYILGDKNEKPLDKLITDGGFCSIFRTICCIGDSLSSGEMESLNEKNEKGYHDYFDYSWGQYMSRKIGCEVLNFSRGGMMPRNIVKLLHQQIIFGHQKKNAKHIL